MILSLRFRKAEALRKASKAEKADSENMPTCRSYEAIRQVVVLFCPCRSQYACGGMTTAERLPHPQICGGNRRSARRLLRELGAPCTGCCPHNMGRQVTALLTHNTRRTRPGLVLNTK